MNTRKVLVSLLMLVSVLFSACAPAATVTPTATPPSATATPEPATSDPNALAIVTGNYTVDVVGKTFNVILNSDGSYYSLVSSGKFMVTPDQITFVENDSECASQPGIYKWSLENTILYLTPAIDNCQHRVNFFGSREFEKEPAAIILPPSDPKSLALIAGNYTYKDGEEMYQFSLFSNESFISLGSSRVQISNSGAISVTADQITFVGYDAYCETQPGVYHWSLENNVLHLTLVRDDCKRRADIFGTQAFEKVYENNTNAIVTSASTETNALSSAGKIIATIPVGPGPFFVAIGEGSIWVKNVSGQVLRIDPATNKVVATIQLVVGEDYGSISVGEEAVWVSFWYRNMVARIDPQTNTVTAYIPVGNAPQQIGFTPGAVWVANKHDGSVSRIDPAINKVTNTITDVGSAGVDGPSTLVTSAGAVWVEVHNIDALVRIDPATNAIVAKFPGYTGALAANSESIWHGTATGLSRIDPSTNQIVATIQIPLQRDSVLLAIGLGSVWLKTDKLLLRIDSQTNQIIGEMKISGEGDMAVGEGSIWICIEGSQSLLRIEPAP